MNNRVTISTHNRYQKGKLIMNNNIVISNLKKDHFRITERYGKFILGDEYETIKKGRCISIEEHLSPDEFVSSAKAFNEETKAVLDSFTEFVNEFFTYSKPEMYNRASEVISIIKTELVSFLDTSIIYLTKGSEQAKYEELCELNSITDNIRKCLEEFKKTKSRLNKYIDICNEISRVNNEKEGMSFLDIVKGTTTIMDHLVDVIDEYTLNTFTNEQLKTVKDACMLQITNSRDFVNIGTALDLNEEDEKNINHLKASAMRLAMMVKQIDLVIS
jgi:hypothetical protein